MGKITYKISKGTLPITAELIGSNLSPVTHNSYGTYFFDNILQGDYTFKLTDADGCIKVIPINYCDCSDGYEQVVDGCVKYETVAANFISPQKQIYPKSYHSYTDFGTLVFDNGWNIDGTGVHERIPITNNYWVNNGSYTDGPLNRSAVWAENILIPHDIAFSYCIDVVVEKQYYIGVGCDNWSKIKINGQLILDQGGNGGSWPNQIRPLMDMKNTDSQVAFKYWFIYPILLKAGRNVIEVFGHNETLNIAGFGMEIYDASKQDLFLAENDADLGSKLLFRSKNLVGQYLIYTYNPVDGYRGYYCNDKSYAVNDCEGEPYCEKRIFIEC